MLLATDWHPWFSYEWWQGIGVPGLGALGSIAVGAGAIAVALYSNRIARDAAKDAAASKASEKASADRAARFQFGERVIEWFETEVYVRSTSGESGGRRHLSLEAAEKRKDLDLRAANVGQFSAALISALHAKAKSIPMENSSNRLQLTGIMRVIGFDAVRAWIDSPEQWLEMEDASEAFQRKWNGEVASDDTDWGFRHVSRTVVKSPK